MPATRAAQYDDIPPGSLRAWAVAIRPRTLWIAAIPVAVGTAFAWMHAATIEPWVAGLAFVASILMQVITNLQNDVGYTARGHESSRRVGFPRATAKGWLTPWEVRRAIALAIACAVIVGTPLAIHSGPVVAAIGLASVLAALAYMGGPRPIAYTPLGELVVFVFFGLVAVLGAYYLHAGPAGATVWLAAAAIGSHAAAVLVVNNHRDAEHDRRTGRRTFAAAFGRRASAALYAIALWAPFALAAAMVAIDARPGLAAPLLLLPMAARLQSDFLNLPAGPAFNLLLLRTVKLELAFGALLSAGAVLQRALS
ncbi:MAG TPA: 1,4-dihydroxy-2-naphthoate octaprenyltransferase [Usitatibacteraceae bacterium]|nr:1,4-dihydroxy-2-naphthoate octaprenyltransferase [Usitatibacteraceae bacterium]